MASIGMGVREQSGYHGIKLYGKVVDNNDPQKLRRVKVSIPEVYGASTPEELPWALPQCPPNGIGQTSASGTFGVLQVGSEVWVEFQQGDPHFPIIVGVALKTDLQKEEELENYPSRYGFKDETGNVVWVDRSTKTINALTYGGTQLTIDDKGQVTINFADNLNETIAKNWNLIVEGNVTQHVSGNVTQDIVGNAVIRADNVSATVNGNLAADISGTTSIAGAGPISITSDTSIVISSPSTTING